MLCTQEEICCSVLVNTASKEWGAQQNDEMKRRCDFSERRRPALSWREIGFTHQFSKRKLELQIATVFSVKKSARKAWLGCLNRKVKTV